MDPIRQEHQFTLLCEGTADQNFVKKLLEERGGYPSFNYLNPKDHYGTTNFKRMLEAIQGDQKGLSNLKGILILADSASDPTQTFNNIWGQVQAAGNFPLPARPGVTALPDISANNGMPAICILFLPSDTQPGCLETLCVKVLLEQYHWAEACLTAYLSCDKITAHKWPPEKLDKARYHCLVAAIHHDDPSKAVSNAFRSPGRGNLPPLIDVKHQIFDEIAQRIKNFCSALQTAGL